MIEILFKGQTINGDWVFGYLSIIKTNAMKRINKGSYISNDFGAPFAYQVKPETVSQYIGLKDKNGQKIYGGDILKLNITGNADNYNPPNALLHEVEFKNACWGFKPLYPDLISDEDKGWKPFYDCGDLELWPSTYFEIVGNVHGGK